LPVIVREYDTIQSLFTPPNANSFLQANANNSQLPVSIAIQPPSVVAQLVACAKPKHHNLILKLPSAGHTSFLTISAHKAGERGPDDRLKIIAFVPCAHLHGEYFNFPKFDLKRILISLPAVGCYLECQLFFPPHTIDLEETEVKVEAGGELEIVICLQDLGLQQLHKLVPLILHAS
jgi:hypothetical protein